MSHLVVNCNISDFQVKSFTDGTFMVYAFDNAGNKVNTCCINRIMCTNCIHGGVLIITHNQNLPSTLNLHLIDTQSTPQVTLD